MPRHLCGGPGNGRNVHAPGVTAELGQTLGGIGAMTPFLFRVLGHQWRAGGLACGMGSGNRPVWGLLAGAGPEENGKTPGEGNASVNGHNVLLRENTRAPAGPGGRVGIRGERTVI